MYTFLNDKILDEEGREIMMDWETNLMQEHAKVVTENGGDILEIGFGMGICSNFIQEANINKNWHHFLPKIKSSLNKNGIVTWYNPNNKDTVEYNYNNLKWGTLIIKEINVNPPKNMQYKYFSKKIYCVPKLIL